MPGKDPTDPPDAAEALNGLAARLAALVSAKADAFIADAAASADIDKTLRTVTVVARAALGVHALQAAEDKADERAADRRADRAAALVRTVARTRPSAPDEGDDTDMHDHDPRLDTPRGVEEIYQSTQHRMDRLLRGLEIKRAERGAGDRSPTVATDRTASSASDCGAGDCGTSDRGTSDRSPSGQGSGLGAGFELAAEGPPLPTPA